MKKKWKWQEKEKIESEPGKSRMWFKVHRAWNSTTHRRHGK